MGMESNHTTARSMAFSLNHSILSGEQNTHTDIFKTRSDPEFPSLCTVNIIYGRSGRLNFPLYI
jgi:hypothetical protein